jgi:hypothetical protein
MLLVVVLLKFDPVIVTTEPGDALAGENPVTTGVVALTVKETVAT